MGLELFWVTHPIRSVIPSCLPDELWERASNVCTKDRLGNAISFLRAVAAMAALLPPRGPASDKCSSLFSVSCFSPTDCRGECNPSRCQKKLFFQISPRQTARMRSLCSQEGYSAIWLCVTILQDETLKNRQLNLFPLAVDELASLLFCVTFFVTNTHKNRKQMKAAQRLVWCYVFLISFTSISPSSSEFWLSAVRARLERSWMESFCMSNFQNAMFYILLVTFIQT